MLFKVVLLSLVAAASAGIVPAYPAAYHPVNAAYAHPAAAYGDVYAKPQPYSFGYEAKNDYDGALWQQESGDEYGSKRGSYGYTDAYGIRRTVEYVADETGFHAWIKTNEPGTANQNPADVQIAADPVPAPVYHHPNAVVASPHYANAFVAAPAHYGLSYAH
ncbi:cuticle protein 10.9-like [Tachypleus tridentatus]|uniref:cuticle protein 10.9-like n=1 Tax=Tachypleus tridentatus TaxID=6853 RepID=UPI003FCF52B8